MCTLANIEHPDDIRHYANVKVILNPLYTNGFFLLVQYDKLGIVHCTHLGVSDYNFQKICILLSEDLLYLYKQCKP